MSRGVSRSARTAWTNPVGETSGARRSAWTAAGAARSPPAVSCLPTRIALDAVLEALSLRQGLELLQRVVLDLTDALARDAECAADLLERARLLAGEPEAELDHLPLALG